MVATRRMVQQDPAEDELVSDLSTMLAKKPVRKTRAKTTSTKTTTAKGGPTKGKKADSEPEAVEDQDVEGAPPQPAIKTTRARGRPKKEVPVAEEEPAESTQATRTAKSGSLRVKKGPTISEEEPSQPIKPTRSTKGCTLRGRKGAPMIDQEVEVPSEVEEAPKPTKASKARSVRGKRSDAPLEDAPALPAPELKSTCVAQATATKPPPLSPKKITQVTRAATRSTRNTESKAGAKSTQKATGTTRTGRRKRTVSDENAELPDLQPAFDEDDVMISSSTPIKTRNTRAAVAKQVVRAESEVSMSSRPTTPNDSTLQSFDLNRDDNGEIVQTEDFVDEDNELDRAADREASDDELCGPKTPMKRGSPGAEARYLSSVQRTIRKYEDQQRLQTPAQRSAIFGRQRGTPQTQKAYRKADAPSSEVRPMTVSRGVGRAFVFRDLREGAPAIPERAPAIDEEDEAELSFVPDENIIPLNDYQVVQSTGMEINSPSLSSIGPLQLHSPPESVPEGASEDEEELADVAVPYDDEKDGFFAPADIEQDPEETMLDDELEDMDASLTPQAPASFDTDDTVIITSRVPAAVDTTMQNTDADESKSEHGSVLVDNAVAIASTAIERQPKQRHATITVNFDDLFSGARTINQHERVEATLLDGDQSHASNEGVDTLLGAEMVFDLEVADVEPSTANPQQSTRRQTVNLNEFIDVAALAEPTQALNLGTDEALAQLSDSTAATKDDVEEPFEQDEIAEEPRSVGELDDGYSAVEAPSQQPSLPHYALPTFAFDARRKSLPAISHQTPMRIGSRPSTSDGASMPRVAHPFSDAWWSRSRATSVVATPVKARQSTAHPAPLLRSPVVKTPVVTPGERFPRLAPRQDYEEHAKTVAAPSRFKDLDEKVTKRRETFHKAAAGHVIQSALQPASPNTPVTAEKAQTYMPIAVETPVATPEERYPRLKPRTDYQDHAKTVAAPVRFRTPTKTPLQRPATTQKPESLRKAALKARTPMASRTPTRTPLKPAAMTPGQEPMTPHPAAPLRGILALVEIFTLEGASASSPFVALLHRLGAKTTKAWSDRVTHVIFKDGSPTTLQRVRIHNKGLIEGQGGSMIHCVNSRWVADCDTTGTRVNESEEAYAVDVAEVPRGGRRRRKSMEPSALMNLGGNIVRDRKSSTRTPSFGRSPLKFAMDSPAPTAPKTGIDMAATPLRDAMLAQKENGGDDGSSPVTPAWIAAPDQLVQQTAPMNRVRKLDLPGKEQTKSRRLTFWNGGN